MFKQYFKFSLRSLWKHKWFTLINVTGLSLGFASVLCLGLFLYQYYTTDNIQENKQSIYYLKSFGPDGSSIGVTTFPLLYEVEKQAPEVQAVTHWQGWYWPWLKFHDRQAQESTQFVDTGFFRIFSFPFKEGAPGLALKGKYSVVLSEKMARELFGREPALGKTVMADDTLALTVTGVLKEIPSNSSLRSDVFIPMDILQDNHDFVQGADWYNSFSEGYLLLRNGADTAALNQKIKKIVHQFYVGDQKNTVIRVVPFSKKREEASANILAMVRSGIIACAFILLVILVNLLNLNGAVVYGRIKEVALKQMMGSSRGNIVWEFCIENALVVIFSLVLGFLLFTDFLLPFVSQMLGAQAAELHFNWDHDHGLIVWLASAALLVILLAGGYPALRLTSLKPSEAVKGKGSLKVRNGWMGNLFICLQFVVAVLLICAAVVFNSQIHYMKRAALGFEKDNVLVGNIDLAFSNRTSAENAFSGVLNNLRADPYVHGFTVGTQIPTAYWQNYNEYVDVETAKKVSLRQTTMDTGFVNTYQIPIIAGHNFLGVASDKDNILLNETAVKAFGWQNAIGRKLRSSGSNDMFTVIGVMKDFHYEDLQQPIGPLMQGFSGPPALKYNKYLSVRVDPRKRAQVIGLLERAFRGMGGRRAFSYQFMDQLVQRQYALLTGILSVTGYVAMLIVVIACMGMLGLIALFAQRRVKEIGIRKVLGANLWNIYTILSRDFLLVVVLATAIALPLASWFMNRWLEDFAYRVPLRWWMFAEAGVSALLIAVLTLSTQVIRAGLSSPAKSLRTE